MAPDAAAARSRRDAAAERRAARARVEDPDVVMEAAAAFLAARPRSVSETRQRLVRLGYPGRLCDEVIERLVHLGYLDDHAFATAWVESRDRARPRGRLALRRELQLKGVAGDVIDAVLEEREARSSPADAGGPSAAPRTAAASGARSAADVTAATRLLERRAASLAREPDPRRRRQRAYALLAGRGFTPDVCRDVAAAFVRESGPAGDDGAV